MSISESDESKECQNDRWRHAESEQKQPWINYNPKNAKTRRATPVNEAHGRGELNRCVAVTRRCSGETQRPSVWMSVKRLRWISMFAAVSQRGTASGCLCPRLWRVPFVNSASESVCKQCHVCEVCWAPGISCSERKTVCIHMFFLLFFKPLLHHFILLDTYIYVCLSLFLVICWSTNIVMVIIVYPYRANTQRSES